MAIGYEDLAFHLLAPSIPQFKANTNMDIGKRTPLTKQNALTKYVFIYRASIAAG